MDFEDNYICVMSALQAIQGLNMDEVIKTTSLAIKILKLEIGEGDLKEFVFKCIFISSVTFH